MYLCRLSRERESLPQHHKALLEDRMRLLTLQEADLREREGAWRAEERLRRERLETLLTSAQAEARIVRERASADVAEERFVRVSMGYWMDCPYGSFSLAFLYLTYDTLIVLFLVLVSICP